MGGFQEHVCEPLAEDIPRGCGDEYLCLEKEICVPLQATSSYFSLSVCCRNPRHASYILGPLLNISFVICLCRVTWWWWGLSTGWWPHVTLMLVSALAVPSACGRGSHTGSCHFQGLLHLLLNKFIKRASTPQ